VKNAEQVLWDEGAQAIQVLLNAVERQVAPAPYGDEFHSILREATRLAEGVSASTPRGEVVSLTANCIRAATTESLQRIAPEAVREIRLSLLLVAMETVSIEERLTLGDWPPGVYEALEPADCAEELAHMAEGTGRPWGRLLSRGTLYSVWLRSQAHANQVLNAERKEGGSKIANQCDERFVATVERISGPITVEDYVAVLLEDEGRLVQGRREFSRVSRPRIKRYWRHQLSRDRDLRARVCALLASGGLRAVS
jgi:hypothetical protein